LSLAPRSSSPVYSFESRCGVAYEPHAPVYRPSPHTGAAVAGSRASLAASGPPSSCVRGQGAPAPLGPCPRPGLGHPAPAKPHYGQGRGAAEGPGLQNSGARGLRERRPKPRRCVSTYGRVPCSICCLMGCLCTLIHTPADSGRIEGPSGDAARRPPVPKALPPAAASGRRAAGRWQAGKLARSGVARAT
jgi:hypothetical protein